MSLKLGVLISGGGTNLQAIIDSIQSGELDATIEVVISNRKGAYGLTRADEAGIPAVYIGKANYPNEEERNEALSQILESHDVQLVVLAGYLSILSVDLIRKFERHIINIHPSLIPKYCGEGFYGHHVHDAVIANGESSSGVTTHYVDEGVDTGEIIFQVEVPVFKSDTADDLAARVLTQEHKLLIETIKTFIIN